MATFRDNYCPEDVCAFVKDEFPAISEDALQAIAANEIDGEMFIELNDEYLRELAPKLCDRIRLKKAVNMALSLTSPVSKAIMS